MENRIELYHTKESDVERKITSEFRKAIDMKDFERAKKTILDLYDKGELDSISDFQNELMYDVQDEDDMDCWFWDVYDFCDSEGIWIEL